MKLFTSSFKGATTVPFRRAIGKILLWFIAAATDAQEPENMRSHQAIVVPEKMIASAMDSLRGSRMRKAAYRIASARLAGQEAIHAPRSRQAASEDESGFENDRPAAGGALQ